MLTINGDWVSIYDELPQKGDAVYVIRAWIASGGVVAGQKFKQLVYASRKTDKPLMIDADHSKNCYWYTEDLRSNFADSTVSHWFKTYGGNGIQIPDIESLRDYKIRISDAN